MLRNYMKKILSSPLFWICSVILAVAMFLGTYEDLQVANNNPISLIYCWIVTNSIGIAQVLLPVLSAMPFIYFYVDRLEKKAIYYIMIRSNIREYYLADIAAAMCTSVLVSLVACAIFLVTCMAFGAGNGTQNTVVEYFSKTWFAHWSAEGAYNRILIIYVMDYLLFSLPWALFGMLASLFCKNRYVVIAAPFICFMLISYITEILSVAYLNPGNMLLKGFILKTPGGGILYAAVYLIGLSVVLGACYYRISRRKIKHEGI